MELYQATRDGRGITTVLANNEAEAKDKITDALNQPGRTELYLQWVNGGKEIKK